MPVIWLDVTTILRWFRPAVGIIRVEAEWANYALGAEDGQIHFCRFESAEGNWREVSRSDVLRALKLIRTDEDSRSAAVSITDNSLSTPAPVSREVKFKRLVLRTIESLPQVLRQRAFNFAARRRAAFQAALRGYRETRLAAREFLRPTMSAMVVPINPRLESRPDPESAVPFARDDVYVSLGLDWDDKDFCRLFAQKRRIGFKALMFCYDIIPVKFPHLCVGDVAALFARYFANVAWCADEILCISECSRRDLTGLLEELGTPVPPMSVIKLGCDIPLAKAGDPSPEVARLLGSRFILYVSTIERRKNHEVLYRAYTRLVDGGATDLPLLVFVGMPGWGVNDLLLDLQLDPRILPYVRILNHVSDGDLARLYQRSEFTVFPSLYEGWGLPVAESLATGKFCLASNAPSLLEVGGDLIEYLDPWNVQAWAERLSWYFSHPDVIAQREELIRRKFRPTTWKETTSFLRESAEKLITPES